MQATPWTAGAAGLGALVMAALLAGLAAVATGCDEGNEADMYQQMMAGGSQGSSSRPQPSAGQDAGMGLQTGAEATGEEAASDEPVLVENLVIEKVDVKAPYPEHTGEGRYDVKVYLMTEEHAEPQVYRIVAVDKDGNEVGSQEKHLKLPQKKARSFNFSGFYCTAMPVTVAFYLTNKQAVAASGESGAAGAAVSGSGAATAPPPGGSLGFAGAETEEEEDS